MPCYHPVKAYPTRPDSETGKRGITFDRQEAVGLRSVTLPCGRCVGCRIDRSRDWAIRIQHEAKFHPRSSFVTLTYRPEAVPPGGTLRPTDMVEFWNRLRAHVNREARKTDPNADRKKVRYFQCGEYGERTGRPHHHAIIFGVDFREDRKHYRDTKRGEKLWTSEILDKLWSHGRCYIGTVTYQSAGYCARYIMKKIVGERAEEHYRRFDPETGEVYQLHPEYCTMSRRPGIGALHMQKYASDVYPDDFIIVAGKKHPVPPYYDKLLKRENPELFDRVKEERALRADNPKNRWNSTTSRLAVRETVQEAKLSMLKREENDS